MKFRIVLVIILFSSFAYADQYKGFCKDERVWNHFESMVQKHPDDVPLQILHALKIGLCEKIREGSILISEAVALFNNMVDALADKRGDGQRKKDL